MWANCYRIAPARYRAELDSAHAALDKAQANVGSTKLRAQRYAELAAIKAVSQQDSGDSQAWLAQGLAVVSSAKAAPETSDINLDIRFYWVAALQDSSASKNLIACCSARPASGTSTE